MCFFCRCSYVSISSNSVLVFLLRPLTNPLCRLLLAQPIKFLDAKDLHVSAHCMLDSQALLFIYFFSQMISIWDFSQFTSTFSSPELGSHGWTQSWSLQCLGSMNNNLDRENEQYELKNNMCRYLKALMGLMVKHLSSSIIVCTQIF